ncbi:hypothetical protein GCM10009596_10870 [Arthrobacter rhombi]|uniref:CDP-glycerol:glycerophosphate glycerophosphotransferase n=1 Tax=Arthrobacter rhombi TaxID=71253 RepID=UPI0031CDE19D
MPNELFSVLVAAYNVESYIQGTLTSLERQTFGIDNIQVIIVDDGSTDSTLRIAQKWAKKQKNTTVLTQANEGAASARKLALEHATGTWVTVVDPDDILDRDYFSAVADFIERDTQGECTMLVSRVVLLNGETGGLTNGHPLDFRFRDGSRITSLLEEPTNIQLGATAFLRRSILSAHDLTYNPLIEPTFEDAHLLGRYLSTVDNPIIGIVADARYYYRKRSDQSSLVQSSWGTNARYSTVLELGYLDMLRQVKNSLGYVPRWAQNMVLYDLAWYFKEESKQHSRTAWISGQLKEDFLTLLSKVFAHIEVEAILELSINPIWWSMREMLLSYFKSTFSGTSRIFQWGVDSKVGGNQYTILYSGIPPQVEIYVNGVASLPSTDNYTNHVFFGERMMTERSFSVSEPGHVRVYVDGQKANIERSANPTPPRPVFGGHVLAPAATSNDDTAKSPLRLRLRNLNSQLAERRQRAKRILTRVEVEALALSKPSTKVVVDAGERLLAKANHRRNAERELDHADELKKQASSPAARGKYGGAWVVMDRPDNADDNGEHLYRHLLRNRPDIKAFFLLRRSSADWDRLSAEGFRLVAYGSDESVLLILNCRYRISSDAVADVMFPIPRNRFDYSGSKFIFLQHGVTKDDLSRWLNPKRMDGMICATHDEYNSIVGTESPYTLRKRQVGLTGFPRFDALLKLRNSEPSDGNLILVMPTWRQELVNGFANATGTQSATDFFQQSTFGQNWLDFLSSAGLREAAEHHNLEIGFLPHPSLSKYLNALSLPSHVRILDTKEDGFQATLAKARIFVTDYSSVAFDSALLGIPVVYFQFDSEEIFSGKHNYRRGYFDYDQHGFGPVAAELSEAVSLVERTLAHGSEDFLFPFRNRALSTFAHLDQNNSARTATFIESL